MQTKQICGAVFERIVENMLLGLVAESRFRRKEGSELQLESVLFCLIDGGDSVKYEASLSVAKAVATGMLMTRDLVNAPPNICNPETLGNAARALAMEFSETLTCRVLSTKECEERKMGAYLAVNKGSRYEANFIHLTYKAPGTSTEGNAVATQKVCLVGKGICMDTGGYNLKVGGMIESMKFDMAGAGAVLGAMRALSILKPKCVEVHAIVAAAENVIDSKSYLPGDIVVASNGTFIEVGNTDAEGRLTLADALVYAETEVKPNFIIDCATLTGAVMVALGPSVGALYGNDQRWMTTALAA